GCEASALIAITRGGAQLTTCERERSLLLHQQQRLTAFRDAVPVVGFFFLETPDVPLGRNQDELAAVHAPRPRRKSGDELIAPGLGFQREAVGVGRRVHQGDLADRPAVRAHEIPGAEHLIGGVLAPLCGRERLEEIERAGRMRRFEQAVLDFVELEKRRAPGVDQAQRIVVDRPGGHVLDVGKGGRAVLGKIEGAARPRNVELEGDDAGLVALGVRHFPAAEHRIDRIARRRAGLRGGVGDAREQQTQREETETMPHAKPPHFRLGGHGVSGTGVSGFLPAAQATRLSTTSWFMALRVGTEPDPTWGSSTTLSIAISSGGTCGSLAYTASPAERILRSLSAAISASWSTTD